MKNAFKPKHEPKDLKEQDRIHSDYKEPSILAGLLLTAAITALAMALRHIHGVSTFSPMILSIFIGMLFHNLIGTPRRAKKGIAFTLRRILRGSIVLLGLQLTFSQIEQVGMKGMFIIAATLICTFVFTKFMGKVLGVERKLAELIAAGTSICGASAIIATNTVTNARDEDVAYAVAGVTIFGSIAMFTYPWLSTLLNLDPHTYGLWAGSSIHEIAQVVAATFQNGTVSGEFGTIAKLSRVMLMAPLVISLGVLYRFFPQEDNHQTKAKPPIPWFVFCFILMISANSFIKIPQAIHTDIVDITTFGLSMSLAAMGLETDFKKLKAEGIRPFFLGFIASIFISVFSFTLIHMTL